MLSIKIKNYRNTRRKNRVEILLNNMVDKDIQLMLLPLNLMQNIFFCPKYCIKNNFITPNSIKSNIITLLGTVVFILSFAYRTYRLYFDQEVFKYLSAVYHTSYYDCSFYCIGFTMSYIVSVKQTKNNIKIVLTIQKIHRFLTDKTSYKRFIIGNWLSVIMALSFYAIIFTLFCIRRNVPYYSVFTGFVVLSFDLCIVYAIRIIKLLVDKLVLWNIKALNSEGIRNTEDKTFTKKMFQAYVDILETYNILKVCFQQHILYYSVEMFSHALVYINISLETYVISINRHERGVGSFTAFFVFLLLTKNWLWLTILSQQCEKFYIAVQNTQDTCALILKSNCSDEGKKLCKNIQRLHRASFSKMSACGLFYVDAALPLNMIGLLANYTLVLLQFVCH